jgi:hypothetical protein
VGLISERTRIYRLKSEQTIFRIWGSGCAWTLGLVYFLLSKNRITQLIHYIDSTVYNICATWLAHEPDQYDIRSGTFEIPHHFPEHAHEDKLRVGYTSPMRKKPSKMFAAFTCIDVENKKNIQLNMAIEDWNERAVEGRVSTWERENRYFCARGCYVAVL